MNIRLYNSKNMFFKGNEIKNEIDKAVDIFQNNNSLVDILTAFNQNKNLRKTSSNSYTMDDCVFLLGSKLMMTGAVELYKTLNDFNITCAPKLVKSAQSSGGQYCLLVLEIPTLKTKTFLDNKNAVSLAQRAKFVDELEQLYRTKGVYNPKILTNPEEIQITKEDKIYFANWEELDSFDSMAEKNSWFDRLRGLLGLERP